MIAPKSAIVAAPMISWPKVVEISPASFSTGIRTPSEVAQRMIATSRGVSTRPPAFEAEADHERDPERQREPARRSVAAPARAACRTRSRDRPGTARRRARSARPPRSTASTSTMPSTDGPITIPATISSTTEGSRSRGTRPSANGAANATRDDDEQVAELGHARCGLAGPRRALRNGRAGGRHDLGAACRSAGRSPRPWRRSPTGSRRTPVRGRSRRRCAGWRSPRASRTRSSRPGGGASTRPGSRPPRRSAGIGEGLGERPPRPGRLLAHPPQDLLAGANPAGELGVRLLELDDPGEVGVQAAALRRGDQHRAPLDGRAHRDGMPVERDPLVRGGQQHRSSQAARAGRQRTGLRRPRTRSSRAPPRRLPRPSPRSRRGRRRAGARPRPDRAPAAAGRRPRTRRPRRRAGDRRRAAVSPTSSRRAAAGPSCHGYSTTSSSGVCSMRIRGASMELVSTYCCSPVSTMSATPAGATWSTRLSAPPVYQAKLGGRRSSRAPRPRRSISSRRRSGAARAHSKRSTSGAPQRGARRSRPRRRGTRRPPS